jgi:murein DD-endopeptidase MepM/ murein hydrolase activator NlpD
LKRAQKNFLPSHISRRAFLIHVICSSNKTGKGNEARFLDQAMSWLEADKPLASQEHYMMIINSCLRTLKDRKQLEETYSRLAAKFPDEPSVYDEYGFALYAAFRVHGQSNEELRSQAVRLRKKAHDLFWKNGLPKPVTGLSHPLRGRNAVWSQFNGKAMTHNGFAAYCYDFAAVDNQDRILPPSSQGSKTDDYYMFGKPVYAVANGTVSGIVAGFPDNSPSSYGNEANTITIEHDAFYSFYAHMKDGGILAAEKQQVKAGDLLGYVGNSGMSSQPHLHFCVYGKKEWVSVPFQFKKARVKTKKRRLDRNGQAVRRRRGS